MGRITRASLADSVYQTIRDAIVSGALPQGKELSEVSLAAELGVSRTPVHVAVGRLAQDGLVEQLPGCRPRVVALSAREIAEVYEMRLLLEPAAAGRAAERLDAARLDALRAESERLACAPASGGWAAHAIDFDIRFHDTLADACGNARLRAEITKYRHLVRASCRLSGSIANLRAAIDEHRSVLDALQARDPSAARHAMTAHIEARLHAVLRELDAQARAKGA
jgi:DNA-binding GntR family transcriptional regulator